MDVLVHDDYLIIFLKISGSHTWNLDVKSSGLAQWRLQMKWFRKSRDEVIVASVADQWMVTVWTPNGTVRAASILADLAKAEAHALEIHLEVGEIIVICKPHSVVEKRIVNL